MISVCIPTYNGEKFIAEQLNSILNQIGYNDEIIISDDGSTDHTIAIILGLSDSRIKIYHHNKKTSLTHKYMYATLNLENALKHAKGDFIYLADQDDVWDINRVNITQKHFNQHSLVCCDCYIMNQFGEVISPSYYKWNNSKKGIIKNITKNSYLGCCMAFKRELLTKILPISTYSVPHDIWIGLISEVFGSVYFDNNKLVGYRRHSNNLSPSSGKSNNSFFYKLKYRLVVVYALSSRIISRIFNK